MDCSNTQRCRGIKSILQYKQDGQNCKFLGTFLGKTNFLELSWEFLGLKIRFPILSWKYLSFTVLILIRDQVSASWQSRNCSSILQNHQDGEICNFLGTFSDLSWEFPGLKIWFLETPWKELSFLLRILIRDQRSSSLERSAYRRIQAVDAASTSA